MDFGIILLAIVMFVFGYVLKQEIYNRQNSNHSAKGGKQGGGSTSKPNNNSNPNVN
jgi:cytochrome c biogenesis protein ResB